MASSARDKLLQELAADESSRIAEQKKQERDQEEQERKRARDIEAAQEVGRVEALREISKQKHIAEAEAAHKAKVMEDTQTQPKKRGRPKRAAEPAQKAPPVWANPQTVKADPGGSKAWTAEGKKTKRKVLALARRLGPRLQGHVVTASEDTDEAWAEALSEMQATLGEASAEVNVKSLFVNTLKSYELVSSMGKLNPLGWDTTGLTQAAMSKEQWEMFDPDLVELSIIYGEWFSSGPVFRLVANTMQLIQRVDQQNTHGVRSGMSEPVSSEQQDKYKDM